MNFLVLSLYMGQWTKILVSCQLSMMLIHSKHSTWLSTVWNKCSLIFNLTLMTRIPIAVKGFLVTIIPDVSACCCGSLNMPNTHYMSSNTQRIWILDGFEKKMQWIWLWFYHSLLVYTTWSNSQHSPNMQWNKQTGTPVLYPVQLLGLWLYHCREGEACPFSTVGL